jgi:FAD/FMN-containing dehydrogenase
VSVSLSRELADAVGAGHVLEAPDLRAGHERDWTGRFGGPARAVVRPGSAAEVAAVLRACGAHGAAVVPQGGNTGLVGGGVPRGGEVVLSLARLDEVGEVDEDSGQLEAGAGATLAAVQQRARAAGLGFGVDFGARDGATIGGLVATDAGGVRAVRHGTMRRQVAGLEAVLADGSVLRRMSGTLKDNAGYDLPALLTGSEGTLAVVTRARLRLVPDPPQRAVALVALGGLRDGLRLLAALRRLPSLEAADFLLDDGLELVLAHARLPPPLPARAPAYAVVECAALTDPLPELADALEVAGLDGDVAVADDSARRADLWRYREALSEATVAAGPPPHKLDVAVPPARLPEFADEARRVVARLAPGARCVLFGHLGDGNVHVNVLDLDPGDERVDEAVLRAAAACGGTISAEHGVGVAKARFLHLSRSAAEIAAMRAVKRALDPAGLLNPGVILP